MKRRPKPSVPEVTPAEPAAHATANAILQVKVWLVGVKTYPVCTGGDGACPPEDCGGPESFMDRRNDRFSFDALEDLDTVVEVLQQVVQKDGSEVLALDQETRWRLEDAVERAKAREQAQGRPFSRREVNANLRNGEHHNLMYQQW